MMLRIERRLGQGSSHGIVEVELCRTGILGFYPMCMNFQFEMN